MGPDLNKEVALDASSSPEHRAVPRVLGDTIGPLQLRPEQVASSFSADVRDISIQGVGLLAKQSFVSGTSLVIVAGPAGKGPRKKLTATVRHATALLDGRWVLGCVFSRHLTVDDFDVLG